MSRMASMLDAIFKHSVRRQSGGRWRIAWAMGSPRGPEPDTYAARAGRKEKHLRDIKLIQMKIT